MVVCLNDTIITSYNGGFYVYIMQKKYINLCGNAHFFCVHSNIIMHMIYFEMIKTKICR